MKQKLRFLFLTLITLMVSGMSYAGDTYYISFNGKNEGTTDFFSWNTAKHSFNTKFNGAEYAGISFTSGLKMESATKVSFTSTATSTVIIVQSTWSDKTIKFDDTELAVASAVAGTGNCRIYTLTDVAAGAHSITRGSGENGLFYISVEYTGAVLEVLNAPTISFDSATGEVTISGDANASSIKYTTDGTDPSATNGEAYSAPFTVADGTTVKAICLGDGVTTTNSEISTQVVLLDIEEVAAPTINVVYGTVAIACETPYTTIEYSTDGTNFSAYKSPVTLFEDGTVYARASRQGLNSEVTSTSVTAVSKGDANKSVVLDYKSFDVQTVNGLSTLVGKDDAEGYSISLNNDQKTWSSGNKAINEHSSIKLSNGAQNTLYLPSGISATRITFYSYINSASGSGCGWAEVSDLDTKYDVVPMGAWDDAANPDIRTYPLNGTETSINFKNAGVQLCFYIVLDVVENKAILNAAYDPAEITMTSDEEMPTTTLSITDEEGTPVTGLTVTYTSSKKSVATVDATGKISIVGAGEATITAAVDGGENYMSTSAKLKITVIAADEVLKVTEDNTLVLLSKEEVEAHGYLTATDNWQTGDARVYGPNKEYTGLFLNMSRPERKLTLKEKGAIAFELLVQNGTAGRTYTIQVNDGEATTITHNGTGVESSGLIDCDGITTITLAGTDASVYPVAIVFYTQKPTIAFEMTDAEYATMYYSNKTLTVPTGLRAFTATVEGTQVIEGTVYEAGATIPAGEAVILEGKAGNYSFTALTATSAKTTDGNLLEGSDEAAETTGGDKYYKLTTKDGKVGFYWGAENGGAFTNAAHKAYLVIKGASAASFYTFDCINGIDTVNATTTVDNGAIYNLQGVRMDGKSLKKGIYVVNGKKIVVR